MTLEYFFEIFSVVRKSYLVVSRKFPYIAPVNFLVVFEYRPHFVKRRYKLGEPIFDYQYLCSSEQRRLIEENLLRDFYFILYVGSSSTFESLSISEFIKSSSKSDKLKLSCLLFDFSQILD